MITTCSHKGFPQIEWEIGDILETDPEEKMDVFDATREDKDGNKYSGSAYFFCNEFEEIKDVEKL